MTEKGSEQARSETASEIQARMVGVFSVADSLLVAGRVREARSKYNQIIRDGSSRHEDAILRLLDDAKRQRMKCQYRLLSGTAGPEYDEAMHEAGRRGPESALHVSRCKRRLQTWHQS